MPRVRRNHWPLDYQEGVGYSSAKLEEVVCNPISTAGYCGLCTACRAHQSSLTEQPGGPNPAVQSIFGMEYPDLAFKTVVNWSARDLWMLEEDPDKRPYIWDLP